MALPQHFNGEKKIVLLLLASSVERFSASGMQDFIIKIGKIQEVEITFSFHSG